MKPPNRKGALLHAPIPKPTAQFYDQQRAAHATVSWQREGQRLLTEYTLRGQARHLEALARHLGGIYERLTGSKL
jgi:hypothetical protein